MADLSFDVVIIGGGCKGLAVGAYLAKYGGMSVGIFEDLHELGGGLAGEQPAPGFQGSPHSNSQCDWFYNVCIKDDLPELWEEGFKMVGRMTVSAAIFPDETCLTTYGFDIDPDGKRSAAQIARFSERDAETWMKFRKLYLEKVFPAYMEEVYSLPPLPGQPGPVAKLIMSDPEFAKAGIGPHLMMMTPLQGLKSVFESEKFIVYMLRISQMVGLYCEDAGLALGVIFATIETFTHAMIEGGSHNYAHAMQRVLYRYGARTYTHSEVEKVIIENGVATGIQLKSGARIQAKKAVISTLSPHQLCYNLIGKEYFRSDILMKINALETNRTCPMWYNWALTEYPKFKCHDFNPDIDSDETYSGVTAITLGEQSVTSIITESSYRRMFQMPPEPMLVISTTPPSTKQTPNPKQCDMHVEAAVPPAWAFPEEYWIKFQHEHAEYQMRKFRQFTKNIDWDKVNGLIPVSPLYIAKHLKNMAPAGNWQIIDFIPSQAGAYRPIPELAHHRTPVKNLYATGSAWGSWANSSLVSAYTCYKVMADDFGLRKPWEEQGRPY